jgi:tripartite-type tricarboxylate transporter receptor subunit TctC
LRIASAQAYPTRPVRLIIGYPPGGSADITARLLGQWLSERLGQPFVIESRPGAGTNIATETVVNAPPDGYTLLLVAPANAINVTLYEKLNHNFMRDIAPVAGLIRFPNVIVVNPSVPAKTVPELIAYAKANPGKLNMASSGNGSTIHVSGELFKMMTGVNMVHVPYRGGAPALTDMISGQVQVMFDNVPTSIEFIRAGKLRALAVTTATRSEVLPDLPTVADFVPGYEASAWYGIGVPKGTPDDIIDKLSKEINAILAEPKAKARLADLGASLLAGSPADFGKLVADETEKWGRWSNSPVPSRTEPGALARQPGAIVRPAIIDRRSLRDDAQGIEPRDRPVVDDVIARLHRLGDARHLVELAHIVCEIGVVGDPLLVASK